MLNHKSPPLISHSFEFQNHDRRLPAFVAKGARDGRRVVLRYQSMSMPSTTGERHAQKTCGEYFSRRGHVVSLLLQHEANRCLGFARDGYQGHNLAVGKFKTACSLQLRARRFQLDFLFISADEDGQFGVGF